MSCLGRDGVEDDVMVFGVEARGGEGNWEESWGGV